MTILILRFIYSKKKLDFFKKMRYGIYVMEFKTIMTFLFLLLMMFTTPILTIWSLNNLFNLNILYNFQNWASALFLILVLYRRGS